MASRSLYRSSLSALKSCCRSWAKGHTVATAMRKPFAPGTGCNLAILPHEHPIVQSMVGPDDDAGEEDTPLELEDEAVMVVSETIHMLEAVILAAGMSSNSANEVYQTIVREGIRPLFEGKVWEGKSARAWWEDHDVMDFVSKFAELVPAESADHVGLSSFSPSSACSLLRSQHVGGNLDTGFSLLRMLNEYAHIIDGLESSGFFEVQSHRPTAVDFCVGDVISHKMFGSGVVIGWDEQCLAHPMWIEQNKIQTILAKGAAQPFYTALLSDGTTRYVSQENISLKDRPGPVENNGVSFFFDRYDDELGAYIPNAQMQFLFPVDHESRGARRGREPMGVEHASFSSEDVEAAGSNKGHDAASHCDDTELESDDWTPGTIAQASEAQLLEILQAPHSHSMPDQYRLVAERLWKLYDLEEGPGAAMKLQTGVDAMMARDFDAAHTVFNGLVAEYPSWAEALNKQATLAFLQEDYALSAGLCHQVLELKPAHFGAVDGLIRCSVLMEDWATAREALAISQRLMPSSANYAELQKKLAEMEMEPESALREVEPSDEGK